MKLRKVEISKSSLLLVPEDERILFVQIGIFLNDLAVLQKSMYFSADIRATNDIVRQAQNSQALFFARIQAGKLWEGWQLLQGQFFGTTLSKKYEQDLTDLGSNSLQKLKTYFNGNNLLSSVRNEYAFHYSSKASARINEVIKLAPDSEKFDVFISDGHGNCFYSMSHVLVNFAILRSIDASDHQKAMDTFLREIRRVTRLFLDFLGDVMLVVVKKYIGLEYEEVEIPDPPNINDVRLPYFVGGELSQ